jgi:hypothetical protein
MAIGIGWALWPWSSPCWLLQPLQGQRARYAAPAIIGVTTSAAMIAFAFASHADGLLIFPTIGLGFAVPALVYALTKTGAIMFSARGLQ